jgi:exodeoxyribonuclease VII large subunit
MLGEYAIRVDDATNDLAGAVRERLRRWDARLETLGAKLEALGPPAVLARGYSITRRADDGALVTQWTQVRPGDDVEIALHRGILRARTESATPPAQEASR